MMRKTIKYAEMQMFSLFQSFGKAFNNKLQEGNKVLYKVPIVERRRKSAFLRLHQTFLRMITQPPMNAFLFIRNVTAISMQTMKTELYPSP